ncbi:MAG: PHP domain-containing protein [Firmicutes bacterium]|nr:PHP domain-containing protein [Bacillota bacterium]
MKIYGDYHTHSEFSRDGTATIDAMVKTAKEIGLHEIAITDHGSRAFINGCKTKNYKHIRALIDKAKQEYGIPVYFGVEANLTGRNGQIDVAEDFRRDIDILLCGIHPGVWPAKFWDIFTFLIPNYFCFIFRWFPKSRVRRNTHAMINAIEKNDIDIWTHPNRYFKLNVLEVAKTCVERGTLIELNGKQGINFRPIDFERMLEVGAKFVINSDAHRTKDVGQIDRVTEFLKNCDWQESDIVNLHGPLKRESHVLEKIIEEHQIDGETNIIQDEIFTIDKKEQKRLAKEQKKREKEIRKKAIN